MEEYNGLNHHEYIDKNNKFFNHFNFCDCIWCQKYGLPVLYELPLIEGKRYWFEISKNASSSIKTAYRNTMRRMCAKESYHSGKLYDQVSSEEVPIVVYMDPVKRFITLCNDYFSNKYDNTHSKFGQNIFEELGVLQKGKQNESIPPEKRLEIIFDNLKKITSFHSCHHFYPQSFFVDQNKFKNFELVRREDVNERFNISKNNWINKSSKSILKENLTQKQINLIKEIYSDDYKFIKKHK